MKRTAALLITAAVFFILIQGCSAKSGTTPAAVTTTPGQPVEITSVAGPFPPYNAGGPVVEVTVKNVAAEAVVSLKTTLQLNKTFSFTFDVSAAKPLLPQKSISSRQTLAGGSLSNSVDYPLYINGTLQGGEVFVFIVEGQIAAPR
jgi:hypothetical protein